MAKVRRAKTALRESRKGKSRVASRRVSARKPSAVLEATSLGIEPEQLVTPRWNQGAPFVLPAYPPPNLPVEESSYEGSRGIMHQPLVSPRTSFWLGVGFGMLVVGTLLIVSWQILRVETVEAVVLELARPH